MVSSESDQTTTTTFKITSPTRVVDVPNTIHIDEFFGNVASIRHPQLSACIVDVMAKEGSEEAWQTPEFDEWVIVLQGVVELHFSDSDVKVVKANEGAFLPKNTRVKWVWPGPCKYIPICTPAFTPSNCGREEPDSDKSSQNFITAKTDESMDNLKQLHARSKYPFVYHGCERKRWEDMMDITKGDKKTIADFVYYPPTFEKDGYFTHGTSNPKKLLSVLNHFYQDSKEDWVLLVMSIESLKESKIAKAGDKNSKGIDVIFEFPSPVGDRAPPEGKVFESSNATSEAPEEEPELFPHIQGGIPFDSVLEVVRIKREKSSSEGQGGSLGKFIGVDGGREEFDRFN